MAQQPDVLLRDGFKLAYSIEGEGTPVIIIGSAIYYPRTFSLNLKKKLQMIFMDHRGFGKAPTHFSNDAFEIDVLVDDIEALRQKLGLDQVVIMGHSGHAYIALEYAKKYPANVTHIILIAVSPTGDTVSAADQYFAESVCPERKSLYESNMKHLSCDIQANPDKRFIFYSLRSAPRIWYDYRYDASHL